MKKPMTGEKVIVRYKNPEYDWLWYTVVDSRKHGWLRLQGRDAPDGSPHTKSEHWMHVSEAEEILPDA